MRCRGSRPRCRRCGSASPAGSRAPTIPAAPATTSTTTTISATTSTAAGSIATWSTPAPTSAIRSDSLERAQHAKLDLVCRKLRLRPGDSVVEAGCGWGALAIHMARHYGARVRAFNVSREQLAYARARAGRESARRRSRVHRRRLPQCQRQVRRLRLGRDARARRHAQLPRPFRRPAPDRQARRRPRAAALHRPRRPPAAERLGSPPHLPRRLYADARRGRDARSSRQPACRCSTSRTCACTTPVRWRTGANATPRRVTTSRPGSARSSPAPGSCISPAPRRRSPPAGCSSFKSCSRRVNRRRRRGREPISTAPRAVP